LFGFEVGQGNFFVRAGSQDDYTSFVKLRFCVTKLGRFDGSTGCVGFGKEKEEDALALEIYERDIFTFVGFEMKGGGFGAWFQHGSPFVKNALVLDLSLDRKAASGRRTPKNARRCACARKALIRA
jgi:hypothetical protein